MGDPFKEPGVLLRPFCRNCESLCEVGETECCDKPIGGWTWGHEVNARAAEVDGAVRDAIATEAHAAGYAEALADLRQLGFEEAADVLERHAAKKGGAG